MKSLYMKVVLRRLYIIHEFIIWRNTVDNKLILNLALSDDLIVKKNWNASDLIKEFSTTINGSGGGQNFFAVASSKEFDKSNIVFEKVISFLEKS